MKPAVRCLALIVALACTAHAQDADPLAPLQHGTLVIWVVRPPSERKPDNVPQYRAAQPGYHQSTTANLGQSAGTFGQTAGSYGVDSGSARISAPSSPITQSTPTSSADTPSYSGYRQQVPNSTGQSLSSFGDTLTTIGQPKETTPPPFTLATRPPVGWRERDLQDTFPELKLQISDVYGFDLSAYLEAAVGTPSYPDILFGDFMTKDWPKLKARFAVPIIPHAEYLPDGLATRLDLYRDDYALVAGSQNPDAARAYATWVNLEWCSLCHAEYPAFPLKPEQSKAASVAVTAMQHLWNGESIGDLADPEIAVFSPLIAMYRLAMSDKRIPMEDVHTKVLDTSVHGAIAVVRLRIFVSSDEEFGVVRPVFVLRRNDTDWRVLQVSFNLPPLEAYAVSSTLMATNPPRREEQKAGVMGVTLMVPEDNALVQRTPQLGWYNAGGAGLQVVEWSPSDGENDTHLFFVPDRNVLLRNEVQAQFARFNQKYRWRIWSVGPHGETKLTPWRTFTAIQ